MDRLVVVAVSPPLGVSILLQYHKASSCQAIQSLHSEKTKKGVMGDGEIVVVMLLTMAKLLSL